MWSVILKFIRRNWKLIVMAVLLIALFLSVKHSYTMKQYWLREKANVDALTTDYLLSETQKGEAVLTIKELQYTVDEFKKRQAADAKLIKELRVKASEVREVVKTVTETKIVYRDSMVFVNPHKTVLNWSKDTEWWSVDQTIDLGSMTPVIDFNLQVRDSLTHFLYKVPKCRFLGIRWGVKGYEIKVVNHNPDSKVSYARWISLSKNKRKRDRE